MPNPLYLRDVEGGHWYAYPGRLRPDGTVDTARPDPATMQPVNPTFIVGCDLGQVADYTAFCVVEAHRLNPGSPQEPQYHYEVSHLERHRGVGYPQLVQRAVALCAGLPAPPVLAVDESGVGRPVVDYLRLANPRTSWLLPISITSGADATAQPDGSFHVAKRLLVGAVQVPLQNGHLRAGRNLPLAPTLVKEMLTFQAKITPSGNVIYGAPATTDWRNGPHDDLLLSVALAVWAAPRADAARHNRYVM
jgi:hypothetical protein